VVSRSSHWPKAEMIGLNERQASRERIFSCRPQRECETLKLARVLAREKTSGTQALAQGNQRKNSFIFFCVLFVQGFPCSESMETLSGHMTGGADAGKL